ncbi:MAG: zinc metallopeptidase [Beijerinckiaceae bacterium]
MPLIVIGVVLLLALIFLPQLWIRSVLKRHQVERGDLGGTGAELARDLLDRAGLRHVKVELTEAGDHYDPGDETVRLSLPHHDGKSVAALAVAAHEVSHALQHAHGDRVFNLRQTMAPSVMWIERGAQVVFFMIPLLGALARSPALIAAQIALVVILLGSRLVMHLVTLPVEIDASFRRALPILQAGQYLPDTDMPAARSVLRAAALTYVAAALVSLIDVTRLIRVLR